MPHSRILTEADQPAVEAFLALGTDQAMLIRSNVLAAGLIDRGGWREATYAGAIEAGRVVGLAAHCWNGMLLLQAPVLAAELASLAVTRSGRPVSGFQGPWEHVVVARSALGLADSPAATESKDLFYSLDLSSLKLPDPARLLGIECRPSRDQDLPFLTDWRAQFRCEALRATDSPGLRAQSLAEMTKSHQAGQVHVLWVAGRPVACFNIMAQVPGALMIGNVWTPVAERGHGYAGAVLGLGLLDEAKRGVERAVLFTETGFHAARRTYERLGFKVVGEYGFIVLAEPGKPSQRHHA